MKYAITGADAETGQDRNLIIEGQDETEALAKAKDQGIFVAQIAELPSNATAPSPQRSWLDKLLNTLNTEIFSQAPASSPTDSLDIRKYDAGTPPPDTALFPDIESRDQSLDTAATMDRCTIPSDSEMGIPGRYLSGIILAVGVIYFVAAAIAGIAVGNNGSPEAGWVIFLSGCLGGIFLLALAKVLEYLSDLVEQARSIVRILEKEEEKAGRKDVSTTGADTVSDTNGTS